MNKAREEHYLQRVIQLSGNFPNASPRQTEAPDFIFDGNVCIGVELTDYIRPLVNSSITLRTVESLHERVAREGRRLFEEQHSVPLWVTMHWNPTYRLSKAEAQSLAAELASLIAQSLPDEPNGSVAIDDNTHGDRPIFRAIFRIHVRRLKPGTTGVWWPTEAGFVGVSGSEIQRILDGKESLIAKYLEKCDCVWLVIVADGIRISSTVELELGDQNLITSFERVYFYDGASGQVLQLK